MSEQLTVALNHLQCQAGRCSAELRHQPHPSQQPQRVVDEGFFARLRSFPLPEILQSARGISSSPQGVPSILRAMALRRKVAPVQILVHALHRLVEPGRWSIPLGHHASHVSLGIQHHTSAFMLPSQPARTGESLFGNDEIKIWLLGQTVRAARRARRHPPEPHRPEAGRCSAASVPVEDCARASSHLGEVPRQNGCRSGTGRHVHLRGLPLGGPMPGLSRCGETAWCPSPGGDSGFEPVDPRIHISVMDLPDAQVGVEWDVRACGSFERDAGRWLRLRPGQELPR